MRSNVFVGARALRERKAFRDFLKKNFPEKLKVIYEKISEMVFNDENNVRTSKVLQKLFIEIYEFYVKGDERLEKELIESLRIKYDKEKQPGEVLFQLVEDLKSKERRKNEKG